MKLSRFTHKTLSIKSFTPSISFNKQFFYLLILTGYMSIPAITQSFNLAAEKTLFVSLFYFTFHIAFLILPLAFLSPFYWVLFLIPYLFLIPSELIHVLHYDGYSTLSAITSSIETNPSELVEFLHNYRVYFYVLTPISILLAIYHFKLISRQHKVKFKNRVIIAIFFIAILGFFTTKTIYNQVLIGNNVDITVDAVKELYYRLFRQNYPYSYNIKIYEYAKQRIEFKESIALKRNFTFGISTSADLLHSEKPIHILVIGETSRANNWQLNNYQRKTNPKLSARDDVFYCKDSISVATHTNDSILLTLSRATPHNLKPLNTEKSLITAFNEAGFKTVWLSTQNMTGGGETQVYAIAKESEETQFIGGDYHTVSIYDEKLIPELENIINTNRDTPLLVIIHTMGSHERYRMRYPDSFNAFQPSSKGDDYNWNSPGIRERLLNSYDNSILYTDFVLDKLISTLANSKRIATFTYFSDHGENILDNGSRRFGHGGVMPTKYVIDIPMLFWFSDSYAEKYPSIFENTKKNCGTKSISSDYLFDTLLDFAGITINNYEENNSIAKANFKPGERYILNAQRNPIKYKTIK